MPWLMVSALLGLAIVVLIDVGGAPRPEPAPVTPVMIYGLTRLRAHLRSAPRLGRRPRGTPTFSVEQPDVAGEVESASREETEVARLPSVIVDG